MGLPFSEEQFLRVFAEYNRAVWPLQLVFYFVAGLAVLLAVRKRPSSDRIISGRWRCCGCGWAQFTT